MDGVVEIITGRERRRRWSIEDTLRMVAELAEPGTRVRAVAARHGVCESLLFTWRRQVGAATSDLVTRSIAVSLLLPMEVASVPAYGE